MYNGNHYDNWIQTIYVHVVHDGLAEASVAATYSTSLKTSWNEAMEAIDRASQRMYVQVQSDGYKKIKSVCIMLLNDINTDNVLYAKNIYIANGIPINKRLMILSSIKMDVTIPDTHKIMLI